MLFKKDNPVLMKIQAETIFYNYIRWHDSDYKNVIEIKYAEFKDYYRFGLVYGHGRMMSIYSVFKHNGNVILAPI